MASLRRRSERLFSNNADSSWLLGDHRLTKWQR